MSLGDQNVYVINIVFIHISYVIVERNHFRLVGAEDATILIVKFYIFLFISYYAYMLFFKK